MKIPKQFRLSHKAVHALAWMAEARGITQTEMIELALAQMASQSTKRETNPLLQFAGIITPKEADTMMKTVRARRNKPLAEW